MTKKTKREKLLGGARILSPAETMEAEGCALRELLDEALTLPTLTPEWLEWKNRVSNVLAITTLGKQQ